jgi:hypothetical protein
MRAAFVAPTQTAGTSRLWFVMTEDSVARAHAAAAPCSSMELMRAGAHPSFFRIGCWPSLCFLFLQLQPPRPKGHQQHHIGHKLLTVFQEHWCCCHTSRSPSLLWVGSQRAHHGAPGPRIAAHPACRRDATGGEHGEACGGVTWRRSRAPAPTAPLPCRAGPARCSSRTPLSQLPAQLRLPHDLLGAHCTAFAGDGGVQDSASYHSAG